MEEKILNEEGVKLLKKSGKWIIGGIIGLFLLIIILNSIAVIPAGARGVVFSQVSGVSDKILGEGIHLITPFVDKVIVIDVKIQREDAQAAASSKDLQTVTTSVALNYHLQPDKVRLVYQEIGGDVSQKIIEPAIQETVKAVTAKYSAEELITKRALVRDEIVYILKSKLLKTYIILDELNMTNFSFSGEFAHAIEAKQVAEQKALTAKNDLDRIKVEAQQKVATAQAEATAIGIMADALTRNAQLVQYEAVKKWDGKLPQYTGGAMPFLDVSPKK